MAGIFLGINYGATRFSAGVPCPRFSSHIPIIYPLPCRCKFLLCKVGEDLKMGEKFSTTPQHPYKYATLKAGYPWRKYNARVFPCPFLIQVVRFGPGAYHAVPYVQIRRRPHSFPHSITRYVKPQRTLRHYHRPIPYHNAQSTTDCLIVHDCSQYICLFAPATMVLTRILPIPQVFTTLWAGIDFPGHIPRLPATTSNCQSSHSTHTSPLDRDGMLGRDSKME